MNSPGTTRTLDGAQASGSVAVEAALWRERFCEVAPRMATAVHRVDNGRPPGALPTPRSTRPGASDASTLNASATLNGL